MLGVSLPKEEWKDAPDTHSEQAELQLISVFQMLFISCWNFRLCQPRGNLPQVPISCRNKEQECLESFLSLQRLLTDFKLHSTVSVQHGIHTDKGCLKAGVSSMLYWQPTNCHLEKKYIAEFGFPISDGDHKPRCDRFLLTPPLFFFFFCTVDKWGDAFPACAALCSKSRISCTF